MEAARLGRARRPFYLIVNFATGYTGKTVLGGDPIFRYTVPVKGAKFDMPLYALMTDAGSDATYYDIIRERREYDGTRINRLFGNPQKLTIAAGSMLSGANRKVPADWFYFPEPMIIQRGESLQMIAAQAGYDYGGGASQGQLAPGALVPAAVDISSLRAVFQSERIFQDDDDEGQLSVDEQAEIQAQILTRRQRTVIVALDVPSDLIDKPAPLEFPELDDYALLLGFASGTAKGGGTTFLQNSVLQIATPGGDSWSNDDEGIPVSALCALPFDASNKQTFYRKLLTPYLVGPRRKNLSFNIASRGSLASDDDGKIVAILRTV